MKIYLVILFLQITIQKIIEQNQPYAKIIIYGVWLKIILITLKNYEKTIYKHIYSKSLGIDT